MTTYAWNQLSPLLQGQGLYATLVLTGLSDVSSQELSSRQVRRLHIIPLKTHDAVAEFLRLPPLDSPKESLCLQLAAQAWLHPLPESAAEDSPRCGIAIVPDPLQKQVHLGFHSAEGSAVALMNENSFSQIANLLQDILDRLPEDRHSPEKLISSHLRLQTAPIPLRRLVRGEISCVALDARSHSLEEVHSEPVRAIYSGSFDPLHSGHEQLARAAEEWLSVPVLFELPVMNADKPPLNYLALAQRLSQFRGRPLLLTRAATFLQKSHLFPNCTFIVGVDTAERVLHPRFYGTEQEALTLALKEIEQQGCRFLVAGRVVRNRFQTLGDLAVPVRWRGLFQELPPERFRLDISSSELRARKFPS